MCDFFAFIIMNTEVDFKQKTRVNYLSTEKYLVEQMCTWNVQPKKIYYFRILLKCKFKRIFETQNFNAVDTNTNIVL